MTRVHSNGSRVPPDLLTNPRAVPTALNPFVFPSDTTFRFILLMVSVISASLFIFSSLTYNLKIQTQIEQAERCRPPDIQAGLPNVLDTEAYARFVVADKIYAACMAPYEIAKVGWQLGGVGLLLAFAGVNYWLLPLWTIHRSGLVPLTTAEHPDLVNELGVLCGQIGLVRAPRFVWDPLSPASGGLAFGRRGRLYVRLNGGLVQQFYTNRTAFRAIMLHELAHIRNADVGKTYFAVAIVLAFVLVAVLPYLVSLGRGVGQTTSWILFFDRSARVLALITLVYLSLAAILRTRELYADARALEGGGSPEVLTHLLATNQHTPMASDRWRAALRFHPAGEERQAVLYNPARLLRMGFWEAFGTGIAASIAVQSMTGLLFSVQLGLRRTFPTDIGGALIFALLAAGITGTGIWRAACIAHTARRAALRLGIGLGLGIILGRVLAFQSFIDNSGTRFRTAMSLSTSIIPGLLLLLCLVLVLHWIAISATAWLDLAPEGSLPKRSYAVTLLVAGIGLAIWSGSLLQNETLQHANEQLGAELGMLAQLVVLPRGLILITLIGLWAVPVAADLARHPAGTTVAHGGIQRVRHALVAGSLLGLVFFALQIAVRLWVRRAVPDIDRASDQFALSFYVWTVGRAVGIQVLAAAIAAGWSRRQSALYGLCAAFVAGCVSTAGFLGTLVAVSCLPALAFKAAERCPQGVELGFAWSTFRDITTLGGLVALPVVLLIGALTRRFFVATRAASLGAAIFSILWCCVAVVIQLSGAGQRTVFVALAIVTQVAVATVIVARAARWAFFQGIVGALLTSVMAAGILATTSLALGIKPDAVSPFLAAVSLAVPGGLAIVGTVTLAESSLLWAIRRRRRTVSAAPREGT